MNKYSTYRHFLSFGLLLAFLLSLGFKEGHHLLEHNEIREYCEADLPIHDTHLHDHDYIHHGCFLCVVHLVKFPETEAPAIVLRVRAFPRLAPSLAIDGFSFELPLSIQQRGPPFHG